MVSDLLSVPGTLLISLSHSLPQSLAAIFKYVFNTPNKSISDVTSTDYWREATKALQKVRAIDRKFQCVRQRFAKTMIYDIHKRICLKTAEHREIAFECYRHFLKGKQTREMRRKYDRMRSKENAQKYLEEVFNDRGRNKSTTRNHFTTNEDNSKYSIEGE